MLSANDRFRGALLGLAAGDALGTSVEFSPPGSFTPLTDIAGGGPFQLEPGQWTDDTSMALCLAESLVECRGFDAHDQLERYLRWWRDGYLSATGHCFDIGGTTRAALARYEREREPYPGSTDPQAAGNGSIMRLAPAPLFFAAKPQEAIERAADSSRTTHGARTCVDACRYLAALIVGAMYGASKDLLLSDHYAPMPGYWQMHPLCPEIAAVAAGSFHRRQPPEIRGSGYVVQSLEAALWAFCHSNSFQEGCLLAVNLGDDADTTGAVYGQLAGAYYGEQGIPESWRARLAKRELIETLADRLYELSKLSRQEREVGLLGHLRRRGRELAARSELAPRWQAVPAAPERSLPSDRPIVGIDIGGTKIAVAAVDPTGHILGRAHGPTTAHDSTASFVDALEDLVQEALAGARPLAIGIGCTGPIDPARGTVHNPYTLPLPDGADIASPLRERFQVPVVLENDAFAAALGEQWLGAACRREVVACVTIGTGIGCGLVRGGRAMRGAGGLYPEIGHQAIDPAGPACYCGARGCWESLASGTAIGQAGQEAARLGESPALLALAGGQAEAVTSELVFRAAQEGDRAAREIIDRAVRATAIGVHNIVHFLAPDAIILGGGVMRHYDLFAPAIAEMLARVTMVPQAGLLIAPAELGPDAGMLGAARAAMLDVAR